MTVCKSKIFSLQSSSGTSLEDKWNKLLSFVRIDRYAMTSAGSSMKK